MDDERHVDGNALAGVFHDVFGREMTHESGCCSECGAANLLGAARVYRAAGDVLRCPDCGSVLMVIVPDASGMRVSFGSMRWLRLSMSNARE